jgi:hypothetical protein
MTVVAASLALVVVGTAVWRLVRPEPTGSEGSSPMWVGVNDGDSVPEYIASGRVDLAVLEASASDRPVLALVSFASYLSPDQVALVVRRVPGLATLTGYARVPLPRRQTQRVSLAANRVPADLIGAMADEAQRKDTDAQTYETLASEQPPGTLRTTYASNADVSRAEAAAYRGACACVFALVVRATPAALTALSQQPEVRVVDPAPGVINPDDAVFRPPFPEQVDRVEPFADDALPTQS